ncbi:effector-associated domain 2-containing protein [Streptomyces sp. NBC_00996]|uniref:effector-associated domain 2-containing protein n=1 Tax=Streptomyces sp. NBC_00996 TaxID=2903710 RepID=UPI00386A656E|nr:hypothetical protein OG390_00695 [Streptomyces sp. NBC_00996]
MGKLRRPELAPGRLKELNDALHHLHLLAGQPSVRDLERALGRGAFSHSRIYDVFSRGRLPTWGMVDIIVKALSEQAPGLSAPEERRHFHALWIAASRNNTEPVPQRRSSPQAERLSVGRYMAELSDAFLDLPMMQDPQGRSMCMRYISDAFPDVRFEVPDHLTPRLFALAVMDQVRWIEGGLATLTEYLGYLTGEDPPFQRFKDIAGEALRDVRPPQPDSKDGDPDL